MAKRKLDIAATRLPPGWRQIVAEWAATHEVTAQAVYLAALDCFFRMSDKEAVQLAKALNAVPTHMLAKTGPGRRDPAIQAWLKGLGQVLDAGLEVRKAKPPEGRRRTGEASA